MKVLVIGSGGREHAICWALSQSTLVKSVMVSPGNLAMKETLPKLQVVGIDSLDFESLLKFAQDQKIDLTVVGPEAALTNGIVDLFRKHNLLIVGPEKAASALEGSKSFAKKIMMAENVPTATFDEFFDADLALKYIEESPLKKMVVKCDGLASGKGVVVCSSKNEARIAVISLMKEKMLGENVSHIIIEECLEGVEVSAFAICDGESFAYLGSACDHKRLRNNDQGPNTGGMGVYSPASILSDEDEDWISKNIFSPMMNGMKKNGHPFSGILFAGLMKTNRGWKVLEFNTRLGDPETQVLLPLLNEDITPWLLASARGEIKKLQKDHGRLSPLKKEMKGVHVVMASHGYPGTEGINVRVGDEIKISSDFNLSPYDFLFFAGTKKEGEKLKTCGGRVLGVTSIAETYTYSRARAYDYISQIHFEGAHFRTDIGSGQI